MKYYVLADIHGYCRKTKEALKKAGYEDDTEPHKVIICGDCFDRGMESLDMQDFLLELMRKGELILIRGNHEDLIEDMLDYWERGSYNEEHHFLNGTLDTVLQLTREPAVTLDYDDEKVARKLMNTPLFRKILPFAIDYYETEHYIFVHGWIPCKFERYTIERERYKPLEDWRSATLEQWKKARWINGMEAAYYGIKESGKTIVCGHYHCSFGHSKYEGKGSQYEKDADFSPYYADGIIALDACTAHSGIVNCIVIND